MVISPSRLDKARPQLRLGEPLGARAIPPELATAAGAEAQSFWRRQLESGFSEPVETALVPNAFRRLDWFPTAELAGLGLAATLEQEWVMTADVDPHTDNAWGATLLWVLVNPGLTLWQKGQKVKHVPAPGTWLIFDDRLPHSVAPTRATPEDGVFLAWAVKLRPHDATRRERA